MTLPGLFFNQANHEKKKCRTSYRRDKGADKAICRYTQQTKDPTSNNRANDTDYDIPQKAKTTSFHKSTRQPASQRTNRQKY